MKTVIVIGPAFSASGYGEHCRFVLRSLREHENTYDIYLHPLNWGQTSWEFPDTDEGRWMTELADKLTTKPPADQAFDISLQVTIPNEFNNEVANYNIGCTAGIECDQISPEWIQKCNLMNKVIVVSEHAKSGLLDTSLDAGGGAQLALNTPVDVVGYPVKEISEKKLDIDFSSDFNFLLVALMGVRKNVENTIMWFIEKFHDREDVGLILKTGMAGNSELDLMHTKHKISSILNKYPTRKCKVHLLHGRMTEEEMSSLLQHDKVKAMVSLAHGEGYGLPLFEAAYHGLPVIAPGWSGQMDFLTQEEKGKKKKKKYFSNVQFEMGRVQKEAHWKGVIEPYASWCFPKKVSFQQRIEEMAKEHTRLKSQANKLQKILLEKHSPDKVMAQFMDAMGHVEYVDPIPALREEADKLEGKKKADFIVEKCREIPSQNEKLRFLKDSLKGEKAYIVSCGPTLLDNDQEKLKKLLEENICISVKQAYDLYGEFVDFHVYNCANFKHYDYNKKHPLVMEASSTPYRLGQCDLKFFIKERDFANSLASTDEYEDWTLEKQKVLRPYGPGIMTEAVIYLVEHLGLSEIVTVGYDNRLIGADKEKQHFYTKSGTSFDKKDFIQENDTMSIVPMEKLKEEERISVEAIGKWSKWLSEKGCTLKICSDINQASEDIERVKI